MDNKFVSIAKRENNLKRGYLIVNPSQGKHVPVSPGKALSVFTELAEKLGGKYLNEKLLFIGFAETATAIGAQVAVTAGMPYIQTTRENIPDVEYLYFSEEHSHATEQKLVKTDLDKIIPTVDRIVFVEDEISTGKTILNIIRILQKTYGTRLRFSVMSILNSMTEEDKEKYTGVDAEFLFLQKIDRSPFEEAAARFTQKGKENPVDCSEIDFKECFVKGAVNARRLVDSKQYLDACKNLAAQVIKEQKIGSGQNILVLGTEEFMFPAIYTASKIEELGNTVRTHSTTRSPISAFEEKEYPLHARWELASVYDSKRTTYIYSLAHYDKILIITDSALQEKTGMYSLLNAVKNFSEDIAVIRWV